MQLNITIDMLSMLREGEETKLTHYILLIIYISPLFDG